MAKLLKRVVHSHFESHLDGRFEGEVVCAFKGLAENNLVVIAYLFSDFLRRLADASPKPADKPDKAS